MTLGMLEPTAPRSRVKQSTTEPLRSLKKISCIKVKTECSARETSPIAKCVPNYGVKKNKKNSETDVMGKVAVC